jgi:lipopolysaccharide transport system permease protein
MAAESSQTVAPSNEWVIEPRSRGIGSRLREVWDYRRLFRYFAARALERLYKGTALGKVWLFLRSPIPVFLQAMIFGGVLGVTAPAGLPYFVFLMTGTCVWTLFAQGLMWATRSFQINRSFLGKMYFPRIILPASCMAPAFFFFFVMLVMLGLTFVYYGLAKGQWHMASLSLWPWSVAAVLVAYLLALAIGLFTSVLNAEYRDVRFTLTYVLQFWSLLTPIIYPISAVPEQYRWLVFINPMSSVVQAFKYGILGVEPVSPLQFLTGIVVTLVVLMCGLWYFGRAEGQAVDRI